MTSSRPSESSAGPFCSWGNIRPAANHCSSCWWCQVGVGGGLVSPWVINLQRQMLSRTSGGLRHLLSDPYQGTSSLFVDLFIYLFIWTSTSRSNLHLMKLQGAFGGFGEAALHGRHLLYFQVEPKSLCGQVRTDGAMLAATQESLSRTLMKSKASASEQYERREGRQEVESLENTARCAGTRVPVSGSSRSGL